MSGESKIYTTFILNLFLMFSNEIVKYFNGLVFKLYFYGGINTILKWLHPIIELSAF